MPRKFSHHSQRELMLIKQMKSRSARRDLAANGPGSTTISPRAMLAWSRIPSHNKAEIIEALEASPATDDHSKIVKVGTKMLTVRNIPSGFRVIYEQGDDRNTIISILTPREARLAKG